MKRLRDRPRSEKAIPASAIRSTEQTKPGECRLKRLRDRPRSSAKEKAIPTSAIGSTEQTFSSECQTGNAPPSQLQCRHEGRQNWLHAKQSTPPCEPQGPGRDRRPKWRIPQCSQLPVWTQNDQFFASLVEWVLRWSFSEHWRKDGVDPRPTTYQSRRPPRQGQTVDLLSVRGPGKEAGMLVGALPERLA